MDEKMKQKKLVESKRHEEYFWKFLGSTGYGLAVFGKQISSENWISLKLRNINDGFDSKLDWKTFRCGWSLDEKRLAQNSDLNRILKKIPTLQKDLIPIMELAFENVTSEEEERR